MDSPGPGPRYNVTERDREYMRRLGLLHHRMERDELAAHAALPPRERLAASLALMLRGSYFPARAGQPTDDPSPLYDRARRLGLYRS